MKKITCFFNFYTKDGEHEEDCCGISIITIGSESFGLERQQKDVKDFCIVEWLSKNTYFYFHKGGGLIVIKEYMI